MGIGHTLTPPGHFQRTPEVDLKTDALISLLATGNAPVRRHATTQTLLLAICAGGALSFLTLAGRMGLPANLLSSMQLPALWIKLLPLMALGAAGFVLTHRLARPGARIGAAGWGIVLPLLAIWLVALITLMQAAPEERLPLVLGRTWRVCILNIMTFSAPVLAAGFMALRSLAPTRLALSGAAAGMLAGGVGASIYALRCPELEPAFLAVWYVAGIASTALVGAALGPRLLRW